MADDYKLPGHLGMALMTDRPEFIDLYIAEAAREGDAALPPLDMYLDTIRLIRDLIADRVDREKKIQEDRDRIDYMLDLLPSFERAVTVLKSVQKDRDAQKEEEDA